VLRGSCLLRRTKEECIRDLPSLTRSVVRVLLEHLDRAFTGNSASSSTSPVDAGGQEGDGDKEHGHVDLLSEEAALRVLRQEVTAQKERQRLLRRRRGLDSDDDDGDDGDESHVQGMGRSDLLAALSHEQRLGLAKSTAAMEWLLAWLKETTNDDGGGGKIVVFARHLVVLNALHHMLNQRYNTWKCLKKRRPFYRFDCEQQMPLMRPMFESYFLVISFHSHLSGSAFGLPFTASSVATSTMLLEALTCASSACSKGAGANAG